MAGTVLGIPPRASALQEPTPSRIPASSRTRLVHGAWGLGTTVAAVYSSKREADGNGVSSCLAMGPTGSSQLTVLKAPLYRVSRGTATVLKVRNRVRVSARVLKPVLSDEMGFGEAKASASAQEKGRS